MKLDRVGKGSDFDCIAYGKSKARSLWRWWQGVSLTPLVERLFAKVGFGGRDCFCEASGVAGVAERVKVGIEQLKVERGVSVSEAVREGSYSLEYREKHYSIESISTFSIDRGLPIENLGKVLLD